MKALGETTRPMFEIDFLSMMIPGIQVLPFTGLSGDGARTVGTALSIVGHIRYTRRAVRKNADETVLATAVVEIPPPGYVVNGVITPLVVTDSEVILLDDSVPRHVLEVRLHDDEDGHHHQTLFLT